MRPLRLLAFDPGGVTGIAWYDGVEFVSLELKTYEALLYAQEATIGNWVDLSVVCESFIISQRTLRGTRQYDALESIGVLRFLCRTRGVPFALVTPAASKSFSTDAKLRKLGWYYPTPGGHRNDAARVLLVAAVEQGLVAPEELTG